MKKVVLFLMLVSGVVFGQQFEANKIVENSLSQEQNYKNAITWASSTNMEIRQHEIVTQEKELGLVSNNITAYLGEDDPITFNAKYNVKIDVKDNKYRVSYSSPLLIIGVKYRDYSYYSNKALKIIKAKMDAVKGISSKFFDDKMEWDLAKVIELKNSEKLDPAERDYLSLIIEKFEKFHNETEKNIVETMNTNDAW